MDMSDWSEIVMGEMTGTKELMKSGFKRYSGLALTGLGKSPGG